ncbi:isoprenoid biosynthesis glyoxalase ElbB [Agarivorans sp. QJM3NY_25]|uniref:isoprenoid biosynthesis glyoxalase ElbB n=1 Tax=Agarivorans sp. QJM3NY_25 TaxID=3421430 RepID=UPI003D7D7318
MKKVAVILSGCGVFDGAELGESILTLLHITKAGASYQCFAPDVMQRHTINHLTGEEQQQTRNVLLESARVARGDVKAVTELVAEDFDALIIPGGFGAAKNLSDFAVNGAEASVQGDVLKACKAFAEANKPAAYMCIAPVMIPLVYGPGAQFTIGNDTDTIAVISALGGEHIECAVADIVVDHSRKLVSTPAYMLAQNLVEAELGIAKLVNQVLAMS